MNTLKFSLLRYPLLLLLLAGFVVTGCGDDLDDPDDEGEETITSMVLTFVNANDQTDTRTFAFRDPDGDGGGAPTEFDDITLAANSTYTLSLEVLDESDANDVEDITGEIRDEDDEHLFCFDVTDADVTITKTDSDGTFPVGLTSSWETGAAGNGSVKITLKHQPDVKDGTCAPGDTDIELDFTTEIQ